LLVLLLVLPREARMSRTSEWVGLAALDEREASAGGEAGMSEGRVSQKQTEEDAGHSRKWIVNDSRPGIGAYARDLLDARQRIGEQADELLTKAGEVIGVRRELDGARPVLEAAREQAVAGEDLDAEGGEEGQHIRYRKLCKTTERAIRAYDAARAAGGGEDE
jgi:hypothetical protein